MNLLHALKRPERNISYPHVGEISRRDGTGLDPFSLGIVPRFGEGEQAAAGASEDDGSPSRGVDTTGPEAWIDATTADLDALTRDDLYYEYSRTTDPIGSGAIPPVPSQHNERR